MATTKDNAFCRPIRFWIVSGVMLWIAQVPSIVYGGTGTLPTSEQLQAHWSYMGIEGLDHWAMLSPEYLTCENGSQQSPINIHLPHHRENSETIVFHYNPTQINGTNNGHTLQVDFRSQSGVHVNDRAYHLRQFHFHEPSEHQVEGRSYPMELHLVHQDPQGHIVVVAVFMEVGPENALLTTIFNRIPQSGQSMESERQFNVKDLLPTNTHHYAYRGSLTTPPCTEGVLWIVLKDTIKVSASQIKLFVSAIGDNARPVQPLRDREVLDY
jgi:carbonic anhydrase